MPRSQSNSEDLPEGHGEEEEEKKKKKKKKKRRRRRRRRGSVPEEEDKDDDSSEFGCSTLTELSESAPPTRPQSPMQDNPLRTQHHPASAQKWKDAEVPMEVDPAPVAAPPQQKVAYHLRSPSRELLYFDPEEEEKHSAAAAATIPTGPNTMNGSVLPPAQLLLYYPTNFDHNSGYSSHCCDATTHCPTGDEHRAYSRCTADTHLSFPPPPSRAQFCDRFCDCAFDLRPATCNLQPATCDLRPPTEPQNQQKLRSTEVPKSDRRRRTVAFEASPKKHLPSVAGRDPAPSLRYSFIRSSAERSSQAQNTPIPQHGMLSFSVSPGATSTPLPNSRADCEDQTSAHTHDTLPTIVASFVISSVTADTLPNSNAALGGNGQQPSTVARNSDNFLFSKFDMQPNLPYKFGMPGLLCTASCFCDWKVGQQKLFVGLRELHVWYVGDYELKPSLALSGDSRSIGHGPQRGISLDEVQMGGLHPDDAEASRHQGLNCDVLQAAMGAVRGGAHVRHRQQEQIR
ncbi:hypothetical protein C8T65DRAFT_699647 [Cerioporus squamosus]|nr:hypothetical protein C8T65DRAFT_699647 [Cerioporus squamosus]